MRSDTVISSAALAERLGDLGFSLPDGAFSGLALYLGQLMYSNKTMNLVGTST